MDNKKIKNHIIEITTELIEQYDGDIRKITSRLIAEKANIGLGSINYYFGSKENLIELCVQRIIGNVIAQLDLSKEYKTDKERLKAWANGVFDFLFEHPAISRISILGDFQNYTQDCNSVRTQQGFLLAITRDISEKYRPMIVFALASAMQAAFLGNAIVGTLLGYDLKKAEDRTAFIEKIVSILFEGVEE